MQNKIIETLNDKKFKTRSRRQCNLHKRTIIINLVLINISYYSTHKKNFNFSKKSTYCLMGRVCE